MRSIHEQRAISDPFTRKCEDESCLILKRDHLPTHTLTQKINKKKLQETIFERITQSDDEMNETHEKKNTTKTTTTT